ncbi:MAG TPA: phosphoribosylamine--glycine ligase [Streptosporangiaceae bacterium]
MRVLVIGSGGREHALTRALARDPEVTSLHAAPGNAGIAALADLHPVAATDPAAITELAARLAADLVVVGPEAPLVAGAVDALTAKGITCFGPTAAAAMIEGSKSFAKGVMAAAGIPTATARYCGTAAQAAAALDEFGPPYVVKDDGLASGKGVLVTRDRQAALEHARHCATVVIEEYLDGPELSLFALCDGTTAIPLLPAQDFKRAHDGDHGPNTGGMGAYTPLPWLPSALTSEIMDTVIAPAVTELRRRGTPYRGLLYAGLALTTRGPKVVEFNARFGDPETQVILDRLATPPTALLHAAAATSLAGAPPLRWHPGAAVTVVIAAAGYPGNPSTGDVVEFLMKKKDTERTPSSYVLHAGTTRDEAGHIISTGGRVLNAVGTGPDLATARAAAYQAARTVHLPGSWYRHDIAATPTQCP